MSFVTVSARKGEIPSTGPAGAASGMNPKMTKTGGSRIRKKTDPSINLAELNLTNIHNLDQKSDSSAGPFDPHIVRLILTYSIVLGFFPMQ